MKLFSDIARRLGGAKGEPGTKPAATAPPLPKAALSEYEARFQAHVARYEQLIRGQAIARIPGPTMSRLIREGFADETARLLLDKVVAGDEGLTAACIQLGWRKPTTNYDRLLSAWKRASDDERRRFAFSVVHGWKPADPA